MDQQTVNYYANNASDVSQRYESITSGLAPHFGRAFAPGSRILDIGCGSGRDMAYLSKLGCQVFGMDATSELVGLAQKLHPELCGRITLGALPDAAIPFDGHFDGILCSAVLMHIPVEDQQATALFIKECLKPGGRLLYSIPSQRSDVIGASQRDTAGRLFISNGQAQLQKFFEATGFHLIDQWSNDDSLGRDGITWLSVLMQLGY